MLSCKYHEIFKNAYCEEQLQMAASEFSKIKFLWTYSARTFYIVIIQTNYIRVIA